MSRENGVGDTMYTLSSRQASGRGELEKGSPENEKEGTGPRQGSQKKPREESVRPPI